VIQYAIETAGVTRHFGTVPAVDDLNLHVPRGSVYAFLGPNGAGKTTTIRMLLGLTRPDHGDIRVFRVTSLHCGWWHEPSHRAYK
jgi:ABC-type multidrug transport system ATPase subunit